MMCLFVFGKLFPLKFSVISVIPSCGLNVLITSHRLVVCVVPGRTGRPPSCPNITTASSFLFATSFLSTKSSPRSAKAPSGKRLVFVCFVF